MTLTSGIFGIEYQAIQVILIHLTSMSYMVARGMQSPCSTLIGNQIGKANVVQAYEYFKATVGFLFFMIIIQFAIFIHYKDQIVAFFTQDDTL